jgi:hypothetical protein
MGRMMTKRFDYARIDNPFYVVMIVSLLPILLPLIMMTAIVAPLCKRKHKDVQPPFNRRF